MTNCNLPQVTGECRCSLPIKLPFKQILVPLLNAAGVINKFDSPADVTLTALQAKFDETNPLDRFYALPHFENVENTRAESIFSEYNSGRKKKLRTGIRSFTGWIPDADPKLLGRLEAWNGLEFGVYDIDVNGNFVYQFNAAGEVLPIPVDGNSWDVTMVAETDSDAYHVLLNYDYSQYYSDSHTWLIPRDSLDFDGRVRGVLYGLMPIVPKLVTTAAGTSTTVEVATDCGTPVSGLVFGDFVLYDVTASTDLAVTAAVEDTHKPGTYVLTSTTTVQGNITRLSVSKVKFQSGSVEYTVT